MKNEHWYEPSHDTIRVSPQHVWMLRAWKWLLRERHGVAYVARRTSVYDGGRRIGRRIYLHREIMGLSHGDPREVDHLDGDPTNNELGNLEIVTRAENNRRLHARARTGTP